MQSFKEIRQGDYLYIDKTQYIYDLLGGVKSYFLSRPRRFGKSLLLDTIAEVFCGDSELFKGLWISNSGYKFDKHPVIRLDMSNISNTTPEILQNSLLVELKEQLRKENLNSIGDTPSDIFKNQIKSLFDKYKKQVIVLIDEYDKPMLDHIHNAETAEANRDVMRSFYGILKSMDPYLRLTFITGVTKFSKTSVFSGLNNLYDITLTKEYANICGVPVDELSGHFSEYIKALSLLDEFNNYANLQAEILSWYDGYSWDGVSRVLNPFGLFSFFLQKRFSSYWYASGTPAFLISILKEKPVTLLSLRNLEIGERVLDTFDIRKIDIASLLFQTGYLTIKNIITRQGPPIYQMDVPNLEVKEALFLNIVSEFTGQDEAFTETSYHRLKEAFSYGDLDSVLLILKSLFASIPYNLHINREAYYHSIFYAVMSVLGFDAEAEVNTSYGRIDAVLELTDKVYIMEFKYTDCEPNTEAGEKTRCFKKMFDEGMNQIIDKGYADKFVGSGKDIYLTVFAFLGRDDIQMKHIVQE